MALLSEAEIEEGLKGLRGWERKGNEIVRVFKNKDFVESVGFVNKVAILAEKADHHPDILIRYRNVTLTLSTHSQGGLTGKDFKLAGEIDAL
ncbi:MAG TPA: 4a-hydroxytetrahydrobiopterin dehydratase [Thermodesulfobacteriota bacterium]|jgi:4a-hydroxytetrahydrobiopterin dehydratase|nr:4a-hydroxytetrahydrobiopterin dehydratase [Thermodesulfobacteriota bacterium]